MDTVLNKSTYLEKDRCLPHQQFQIIMYCNFWQYTIFSTKNTENGHLFAHFPLPFFKYRRRSKEMAGAMP